MAFAVSDLAGTLPSDTRCLLGVGKPAHALSELCYLCVKSLIGLIPRRATGWSGRKVFVHAKRIVPNTFCHGGEAVGERIGQGQSTDPQPWREGERVGGGGGDGDLHGLPQKREGRRWSVELEEEPRVHLWGKTMTLRAILATQGFRFKSQLGLTASP